MGGSTARTPGSRPVLNVIAVVCPQGFALSYSVRFPNWNNRVEAVNLCVTLRTRRDLIDMHRNEVNLWNLGTTTLSSRRIEGVLFLWVPPLLSRRPLVSCSARAGDPSFLYRDGQLVFGLFSGYSP